MKTRVVRRFILSQGIERFDVEMWAHWTAPDLRVIYPDALDWRYATSFKDRNEACTFAAMLAQRGEDSPDDIIAEYGE